MSLTGKPGKLYVPADPAPGDDGNDDGGASGAHQLNAFDDAAAGVVAATPDPRGTTSGYRGTASDPWKQLATTKSLTAYDATDPGNVVQAARTGLNGRPGADDDAGDRPGAERVRRARRGDGLARARLRRRAHPVRRGLGRVLRVRSAKPIYDTWGGSA